jgi:acyl carrier protein
MSTASKNHYADYKEGISQQQPTLTEIQNWLVDYLAELLQIESKEIDIKIPFDNYGLDSATAIGLTGDLETWLVIELDPTLIYDYPSVETLSLHLVDRFKAEDLTYSQSI